MRAMMLPLVFTVALPTCSSPNIRGTVVDRSVFEVTAFVLFCVRFRAACCSSVRVSTPSRASFRALRVASRSVGLATMHPVDVVLALERVFVDGDEQRLQVRL